MVLVIALVVLGPSRLPEAARSLGKGVEEFKEGINAVGDVEDDDGYDPDASAGAPVGARVAQLPPAAPATTELPPAAPAVEPFLERIR